MYIDVLSLLEIKKIVADTVIIEHIRKNVSHINAMTINVGKKLTISMVEKSCSFIKKLALMFYKEEPNVMSCRLINTPNTFKTMYCLVKPLLTKHALSVIKIENDDTTTTQSIVVQI